MDKEGARLLAERLAALAKESDSLRRAIEERVRQIGLFVQDVYHDEAAIRAYCRFHQETRAVLLAESEGISYLADRLRRLPDITVHNYDRPETVLGFLGGLLASLWSRDTLRHFRQRLKRTTEVCSSLLFLLENPGLFTDKPG
jgi:hypothetical protein